MIRLAFAIQLALIAGPAMIYGLDLSAAEKPMRHGSHHQMKKPSMSAACVPKLHITDEAEKKPGGAHYKGSVVAHHNDHEKQMMQMKGAHMDHSPRQGGSFFMAPDKMHHLEGVYSAKCGLRLFFYNAFTQPIRADRFKAFIRIVPQKEDEPEVLRFLEPSKDGSILQATIGGDVSPPFDIEALVKFPQSDEPQLFTIKVPSKK
ncbi:MAG TPA: hypothetical protein QF359_06520 [Rhodospirillales bacterium]|jgi:hypothetical protein|nr:hypothetical protein [Rhodospirillales bacterium]MDP7424239.1 hypothetical protein [Rhodospirillales bacterium]HJO86599.1 hypothetical protein [Rhodospirillales bacterium]|tara:strand:+ start:4529 stop:5140 length:612 start_codon:yes stop_codon:yes gene_type:complete